MADALATLHRLRRLATDQARRDLAATLATTLVAETRFTAIQASLTAEAAAAQTDPVHPLAGAYARWLPAAQSQRAAAAIALQEAEAQAALTRAALAEARAAARAVEIIADERAANARHRRLAREQTASDDLASRRPR
jgi:flagellar export protein FliJ